jgi:two-component sensor histidine kinase
VTGRKRDEERLRLLLAELSHRVKNTLATVQAIAARSLSGERTLEEARDALAKRLRALAKTHDLLTASRWRGADLRAVLEGELKPYGKRARLEGPEVELTPKAAQTLALVLHELATNAAKHGALAAPDGWLEVAWSLDRADADEGGGRLRLTWRERGGPPVAPPHRRGFGRTLLEHGLRHDLSGQVALDFAPDGLVCELTVPATAATVAAR